MSEPITPQDIPPLTQAEVLAMLAAASIDVAQDSAEFAIYMQYITGLYEELAPEFAEAQRQALLAVIQRNPPQAVLDAIRARAISNAKDLITNVTQAELSKIQEQIAQQTALGKGPREVARWLDDVKGLDSVRAAQYRKYVEELEASGLSDADIARRSDLYYEKLLRDRKETIARTEMRKATSQVAAEQARLSGAKMKVWLTVGDERVSDQCQADEAAGPIPIDELFPSGNMETPGHPNCLVPETPVFAPDKWAAFVATYSGPVVKIVCSNGRWLTVTPNHMLLTPDGFIMARHVNKGMNILYSPFADRVSRSHPDYDNSPSIIEKVVGSLSKCSGMLTRSVPPSAKYLHGDGVGCNGDIDVVFPDRFLTNTSESISLKHALEFDFNFRDMALLGFAGLGDFYSMLNRMALASDSSMGFFRERAALLLAESLHAQDICLAAGAQGPIVGFENPGNSRSDNSIFLGERQDRHAAVKILQEGGLIDPHSPVASRDVVRAKNFVDKRNATSETLGDVLRAFANHIHLASVERVEVLNYSGHVYDLQSCSTVYTASGFLSSNCRCTVSYYSNTNLTDVYRRQSEERAAQTEQAKA